MGQVALGFRSLLIKSAVFFVMAALLAWALGGTLWPRAETVDGIVTDFGGERYFWRLAVGGREPGTVRWMLLRERPDDEPIPLDERTWTDAAGPVTTDDAMYYAGRVNADGWEIIRVAIDGSRSVHPMPDRLEVEIQFARLEAGLELETAETVRERRPFVLDPPAGG